MYGVLESCLFAPVCIQIELQRNFKLYCLYFFFSKFELPNRGCGLSTGAAYTRNFTVLMSLKFSDLNSFNWKNPGENFIGESGLVFKYVFVPFNTCNKD